MSDYNGISQGAREAAVFNSYSRGNKFKVTIITLSIAIVSLVVLYFFAKSLLTYTVTYVTYGGTVYGEELPPQEYGYLGKTVAPEGLQKEGYYIEGFYNDEDFTDRHQFGSTIYRSKKIYINWQPGVAVELFFLDGEDTLERSENEKTGITESYLKLYYEKWLEPGSTYELPLVFNDTEGNSHKGEQLYWYDNPDGLGEPFITGTYTLDQSVKIYGRWFDAREEMFDVSSDGTFNRYLGTCHNVILPSSVRRFRSIDNPSDFIAGLWDPFVYDGSRYGVFDKVMYDLTTVIVNEECEEINSCAFRSCRNLQLVKFKGNRITKIEQYAFAGCDTLSDIVLPSSVTEICTRSFYGSGIKTISGLDNVETVRDLAFINCEQLTTINLPKVTFIGTNAFAGCYALGNVNLGSEAVVQTNVTTDSQNIFFSCDNVKIIVRDNLVNIYKVTYPWSVYSSRISASSN